MILWLFLKYRLVSYLNKISFLKKHVFIKFHSGFFEISRYLNLIKAIGGVYHVFYKLILFYRVYTKLQVDFYSKIFKLVFEIWLVKVGPHNRYLIGRENENSKKSLFHLKSISSFIFQTIFFNFLQKVYFLNLKKIKWRNFFFLINFLL